MRRSMVAPRASNRPPGMNPTSLEGPPRAVTWTSAVSNAGVVAAGWQSAAVDSKPDRRMALAHVGFIIRSPEPRKAVGRAKGIFVPGDYHSSSAFVDFPHFLRKPNLLKNMGLMPHLRHPTRRCRAAALRKSLIRRTCRYGKGTAS